MTTINDYQLDHIVGGQAISPVQSRRNIINEVLDPSCCWGSELKAEFDAGVKRGHVQPSAWTTKRRWITDIHGAPESLQDRYLEMQSAKQ
jgi:hypothetical protein